MPRIVRETTIRATPDAVFASLTDPAQRKRWLTSMDEQHGPAPLALGSRIPAKRKAAGSTSSYEITITALDPPRRIETAIRRNGAAAGKGGYELSPAAEGATRVRAFAEYELPLLARLMGPVVSANLEKELDADLASLKRHVESATP